ncbi:MAG TPA: DUF1501 domain-containing protein, partial [Planctomycetaceae bacterium]|nr:DUF1501 domain-containing protein [Planctomycetaceae bacterium]
MNDRSRIELPRRDFFRDAAFGMGALAVADLLNRDGKLLAKPVDKNTQAIASSQGLHHPARAKQVIHIFLGGGLSHLDSFDYKPELEKYHDKELPESFGKADVFFGKVGRLHRPHY